MPLDPPNSTGLSWTEDGAPRSERFGDVYFSKDDGLAESRAVFLQGCDLPDAWAGRDRFIVAELGFGTGLNIIALLDLWRRRRPAGARLHVFSIEAFPLTAADAARALAAWPEMAEIARPLLEAWPAGTPGFHRIELPEYSAAIDLAVGDVEWGLSQWSGRADAWFLDGFSPALNPGMWSPTVMELIAARSAPGARLATFTVAGAVRRSLVENGFQVDKRPGHGRKRERLEARLPGFANPAPKPSVVVIGAGIAGASVARALIAQGISVSVIEAEGPGTGASGFPSALVTPRLDAGDMTIAGFHAQALEYARDLYGRIPGAVIAEGVLQLEQTPRDAARFAKVAAQPIWRPDAMSLMSPEAAAGRLGEPCADGGLLMADALAIAPAVVLRTWLAGATPLAGSVSRLEACGTGWRLHRSLGLEFVEADVVVIAAGWGTARLTPEMGLRPVRGQADWTRHETGHEGDDRPPVAWGGYVAPTTTGFLFGATHDRDQEETDARADDSRRNLETLTARLPALAAAVDVETVGAHAAIRATTRDRLPACGAMADRPGLYVLGGLGSRGFCVAPLLGAHVAAILDRSPSPLPAEFARRLAPDRLQASDLLPVRPVG